MINILYNNTNNGPGKVATNLITGLELIGEKYIINQPIDKYKKNIALQWHDNLLEKNYDPKSLIVGPNICTIPSDNNFILSKNYFKIITPSEWVKNLYLRQLPEDLIEVWPVGINHYKFFEINEEKTNDCLIYFKRRNEIDIGKCIKILKKFNQSFDIIFYGSYNEEDFIKKINQSKYIFLINNTESQGIAVQEIMSCNKPILCWDVKYWNDYGEQHKIEASSVPYWDSRVGVKFYDESEIEKSLDSFLNNLLTFKPREYILENLNISKQAKKILNLFKNNE